MKQKTTGGGWAQNRSRPSGAARAFSVRPLRRQILSGVLLFSLAVLCGCQTTPPSLFNVTGPGWRVQQGQALWRPKRDLPELGGDLILVRDDSGCCLIQFDKTPLTLLSAQLTPRRWRLVFPQQPMSFSGAGTPSGRFAWLHLPAALAGKPLPKYLRFEPKPDGGWRLENSRTGETLEGYLAP